MIDQIRRKLEAVDGGSLFASDAPATGVHLDVTVDPAGLRALVKALYDLEFMVESVSAMDVSPKIMVLQHFTRVDVFVRVCVRVFIERENPTCPTISDIYQGANWHERETHDFFGIVFTGHPDMSPLILPEDAGNLKPLLKAEGKLKDVGEILPRFAAPKPAAEEKPEVAS